MQCIILAGESVVRVFKAAVMVTFGIMVGVFWQKSL